MEHSHILLFDNNSFDEPLNDRRLEVCCISTDQLITLFLHRSRVCTKTKQQTWNYKEQLTADLELASRESSSHRTSLLPPLLVYDSAQKSVRRVRPRVITAMSRALCVLCLVLLSLDLSASLVRRRRIVGGQAASPPPPGASEREDVVVNPAFASAQTSRPNSVSTTKRPTRPTPVYSGDDDDNGPIVFLRRGRREAKVKGRKESGDVYAFKGIRYAEAPVGPFRFQVNNLVKW